MKCNQVVFPRDGIDWRNCDQDATHYAFAPGNPDGEPRCPQHADLAKRRGLDVRIIINGAPIVSDD